MAKKSKTPTPIAKCDAKDCAENAAYGFREIIEASSQTATGFIVPFSTNWCEAHDDLMRPQYANKNGFYVDLRNAKEHPA